MGVTVYTQDSLKFDETEYSKLAIIQSPGSYDDGFSIGVQYEHQNRTVYYGGEIFSFPNLHNMPYIHVIGRFGFNFNLIESIRMFGGVRGGLIGREYEAGYAMMGVEGGIDWMLPWIENVFIGVSHSIDEKTDSKRWGRDDSHTVKSGIVRIGLKF